MDYMVSANIWGIDDKLSENLVANTLILHKNEFPTINWHVICSYRCPVNKILQK